MSKWRGKQGESPEPAQQETNEAKRGCWNIGSQKTLRRIISLSVLNTFEIFNKTVLLSIADDTRVYINLFL